MSTLPSDHADVAPCRLGLACRVLETLKNVFDDLRGLRPNIFHLDVRPDNILVLPSDDPTGLSATHFVLIDCRGLAREGPTDAFVFGSRCFLADSLLQLRNESQTTQRRRWTPTAEMDDDATLFTCVAIVASETAHHRGTLEFQRAGGPWLIHVRNGYIAAMRDALMRHGNVSLMTMMTAYLDRAAPILLSLEKEVQKIQVLYADVAPVPSKALLLAISKPAPPGPVARGRGAAAIAAAGVPGSQRRPLEMSPNPASSHASVLAAVARPAAATTPAQKK